MTPSHGDASMCPVRGSEMRQSSVHVTAWIILEGQSGYTVEVWRWMIKLEGTSILNAPSLSRCDRGTNGSVPRPDGAPTICQHPSPACTKVVQEQELPTHKLDLSSTRFVVYFAQFTTCDS